VGLLRSDLYFAKHPDELVVMAQLRNAPLRAQMARRPQPPWWWRSEALGQLAVMLLAAVVAVYLTRLLMSYI
jgi:hypothetical protein